MDNTFEVIANEISMLTEVPVESITSETELQEIGMDSLQALQLLVAIEKHFGIKLQEDDLRRFTSVGSILEVVETQQRVAANG